MQLLGFFTPFVIYAYVLLLHLLVPARHVDGYVTDPETGEPLRYRLNGFAVTVLVISTWVLVSWQGWVPWDYLYQVRWESLAGACTIGLAFSFWVVLRSDDKQRSFAGDLFFGRAENPQFLDHRVDAKMFLYLVGAAMLELNILSFAAHHHLSFGAEASLGVSIYVVLFSWFVFDYMTFERVHLYTYDLFAERVGFKLGWGCLCFYPYFYCVGLWAVAAEPSAGMPAGYFVGAAVVFLTGWSFARGANMQKFVFKRDAEAVFLGVFKPKVVSDGSRRLLCSGFWGISRHVNYLGEILMATGLALSLGHPASPWPWLYPLYYVLLLFPRERDDDKRCAAKYGELWDRYKARVPKRIIPGVY